MTAHGYGNQPHASIHLSETSGPLIIDLNLLEEAGKHGPTEIPSHVPFFSAIWRRWVCLLPAAGRREGSPDQQQQLASAPAHRHPTP